MGNNFYDFYERVNPILYKTDGWVDHVFLDYKKELGTVPHKRLVEKLDLQASIKGYAFNG